MLPADDAQSSEDALEKDEAGALAPAMTSATPILP